MAKFVDRYRDHLEDVFRRGPARLRSRIVDILEYVPGDLSTPSPQTPSRSTTASATQTDPEDARLAAPQSNNTMIPLNRAPLLGLMENRGRALRYDARLGLTYEVKDAIARNFGDLIEQPDESYIELLGDILCYYSDYYMTETGFLNRALPVRGETSGAIAIQLSGPLHGGYWSSDYVEQLIIPFMMYHQSFQITLPLAGLFVVRQLFLSGTIQLCVGDPDYGEFTCLGEVWRSPGSNIAVYFALARRQH